MMLLACSLQASSTRPVWYTNIFATEMTLLPPWGELLLLQLCMTKSENDSQFRSNVKDSSLLSRVVLTVWGVVTLICGAFIFGQSTTIAVMQLIRKTWVHGPEGERERERDRSRLESTSGCKWTDDLSVLVWLEFLWQTFLKSSVTKVPVTFCSAAPTLHL